MALDQTWYTEQWAGQGSAISLKIANKVHDEQSEYQRIEIFETETFGTLMTLDGLVMVTDRDNFVYHEMMTHPALFAHPNPKRVPGDVPGDRRVGRGAGRGLPAGRPGGARRQRTATCP